MTGHNYNPIVTDGKKYSIIYADPPWEYRNKKTGGSMNSGSASHYKTMSFGELISFSEYVWNICDKNAVLFLWTTAPMKSDALVIMRTWGFKYKTTIYWRKIMSLGMGFWFRGQVEELLFGVRGKVKAFRLQEANIIQTKALRHSEKPEEFRKLIERATSKMPIQTRIELFARNRVPGWDAMGDELSTSPNGVIR